MCVCCCCWFLVSLSVSSFCLNTVELTEYDFIFDAPDCFVGKRNVFIFLFLFVCRFAVNNKTCTHNCKRLVQQSGTLIVGWAKPFFACWPRSFFFSANKMQKTQQRRIGSLAPIYSTLAHTQRGRCRTLYLLFWHQQLQI